MDLPEVWLRGPVSEIPALLQPVAHALLQSGEDVDKFINEFPDEKLWNKPAGVASVGFHLQHLRGVLDRLFTYARGQALTSDQLRALQSEGVPMEISAKELVTKFHQQITRALDQLRETDETMLLNSVGVGRKKLPSTVLGLLFHAAEHTQRHTGQLLVTAKILQADYRLP
jgi:uncharacterized damage-inducible protein DinB